MEITKIFLPQSAALTKYNENKMEKLLDYDECAFSIGYSNKGGISFFNTRFYKAPSSYNIEKGSKIYGIAKYDYKWRGSYIEKKN